MPIAFLLAFQAAGTIIDWNQTRSNQKLIRTGRTLEQAAFESNLEGIKLESSQASLDEMRELRQNLGTQLAMQAARGTSSSAGSALTMRQESISTFNQDERTRRMNLLSKEANLRANNVLSGLHSLQSETQLGQAFQQRFIKNLPVSQLGDAFGNTGLGQKWGFGLKPATI